MHYDKMMKHSMVAYLHIWNHIAIECMRTKEGV